MAGKLAAYVYVGTELYGPDSDVPADVARQITNPRAWEGGEAPETEDGGYESMTVAQLREEIGKRNEGRSDDELVSSEGRKADLVAALEADDAAQSE